jgi:hypothetical protein
VPLWPTMTANISVVRGKPHDGTAFGYEDDRLVERFSGEAVFLCEFESKQVPRHVKANDLTSAVVIGTRSICGLLAIDRSASAPRSNLGLPALSMKASGAFFQWLRLSLTAFLTSTSGGARVAPGAFGSASEADSAAYSNTSSARARSEADTAMRSALAVFRLSTARTWSAATQVDPPVLHPSESCRRTPPFDESCRTHSGHN